MTLELGESLRRGRVLLAQAWSRLAEFPDKSQQSVLRHAVKANRVTQVFEAFAGHEASLSRRSYQPGSR